jgi:hypothetical protein
MPALVPAAISALEMVRRREDSVAKFIEVKVGLNLHVGSFRQ